MNINWKVRIKNKYFWLTLIPAVLILIQAVDTEAKRLKVN